MGSGRIVALPSNKIGGILARLHTLPLVSDSILQPAHIITKGKCAWATNLRIPPAPRSGRAISPKTDADFVTAAHLSVLLLVGPPILSIYKLDQGPNDDDDDVLRRTSVDKKEIE